MHLWVALFLSGSVDKIRKGKIDLEDQERRKKPRVGKTCPGQNETPGRGKRCLGNARNMAKGTDGYFPKRE